VDKGPVGDLEISRRPGGLPRGSAGQPAPPNVFSWLHPRTHTRRSVGRGACDTVSFSVTQMPFIIVCVVEVAHAQREQPREARFLCNRPGCRIDCYPCRRRDAPATARPRTPLAALSNAPLGAIAYTRSRRPARAARPCRSYRVLRVPSNTVTADIRASAHERARAASTAHATRRQPAGRAA
jgi:hypothetical protein